MTLMTEYLSQVRGQGGRRRRTGRLVLIIKQIKTLRLRADVSRLELVFSVTVSHVISPHQLAVCLRCEKTLDRV